MAGPSPATQPSPAEGARPRGDREGEDGDYAHESGLSIPSSANDGSELLSQPPPPLAQAPHPQQSPTASPSEALGANISNPVPAAAKKGHVKFSRKDASTKDVRDPRDSRDSTTAARSASPATPAAAIDPLSHHIFVRTNTDRSLAARLRNPTRPDSPAGEALPRPSSDLSSKHSTPQPDASREKKKGPSFLSRLSMIGAKKKGDDILDDESEISEHRTEGVNAIAFTSALGAGYIPLHKEPPRYIRVRAHNKKIREFNRIFLAQALVGTEAVSRDAAVDPAEPTSKKGPASGGPIWSIEFSRDGKYLATGGRDSVVRIWAVIATNEDRKTYEEEEKATTGNEECLSAPVFRKKPIRTFTGHTGDILDLSWSKNNFLLSSSMDKTVRLWHVSRSDCLCTFKHQDFVTSIAFHPRDDRFFLAGSLDSVLRLWSIPDKAVAYSAQLSDIVTAVAFSPDGRTAIAGCFNGFCIFYETEGLRCLTQIHVRSSRGRNAKGSKITGIRTMMFPPDKGDGVVKVLITSNDSRIRIYNLGDKSLELKVKGHTNTSNQIRATFSSDGAHVICGSEDRRTYIWSMSAADSENKEKRPCEYFEAHSDVVTEAVFAPTETRRLLQASHDPIFTLCNPPPVTLLSKEESTTAAASSPNKCDAKPEQQQRANNNKKPPEESPAFIARSAHHDGNIIVTTDLSGLIKVFRQDCAFAKRRHELWETGSTFSRRALGGGGGYRDSLLGRTGSVVTRTSASSRDLNSHSRRGSLSHPHGQHGQLHVNSDRINTWRHGVEGNPSQQGRPVSIALSSSTPAARSERSLSPSKMARGATPTATAAASTSAVGVTPNSASAASEARRQPYYANNANANASASANANATPTIPWPASPTSSVATTTGGGGGQQQAQTQTPSVPPTPSFSFRSFDDEVAEREEENPLQLDPAGASYSFWTFGKWRNLGLQSSAARSGGPPTPSPAPASGQTAGQPAAAAVSSQHARSSSTPLAPMLRGKNRRRSSAVAAAAAGEEGEAGGDDGGDDARTAAAAADKKKAEKAGRRKSVPVGALIAGSATTTTANEEEKEEAAAREEGESQEQQPGCLPVPGLGPGPGRAGRMGSVVSALSSELTSEGDGEGDEGEDPRTKMQCPKCGGREFRAKKKLGVGMGLGGIGMGMGLGMGRAGGEKQKEILLCGKCGRLMGTGT
ncbi:WD40-repeat-containing domain protein [Xylariaceae sp. FL0804]|nr:WD40-repeat-containing domain protein [Xylariaceae sp. FL0804]